jgi:hypothetical protein
MGQYTEVKHTSWGKNIANSFVGALIGVVMFGAAFPVLWINEGRPDLSKIAARSQVVDPNSDGGFNQGQLVAISGPIGASEALGDGPLNAGPYIQLYRKVEMFAWVEREESETEQNTGGGSTTRTTYTYEKEWTTSPADSSRFRVTRGHENPEPPIASETLAVSQAQLGRFQINPREIVMPYGEKLGLSKELLTLQPGQQLAGEFVFQGRGALERPEVGDLRVSWWALRAGSQVTALGKLEGSSVTRYTDAASGGELYRLFVGDRASAIEELRTEYVVWGWIMRAVGLLLMWIGLTLCFAPVTAVLNVLPALGRLSGGLIGAVTFGVALLLTIVTVVIAMIAHSLIALIVTLALIAGAVFAWGRLRRRAPAAA